MIVLGTPGVDELGDALDALRGMQHEGLPVQLHSGDLGWQWRFGSAAAAASVRTWSRAGQVLAVGMLDSPRLLRLTIAREVADDPQLAREMVSDITLPERGVLPRGDVSVEVRFGELLRQGLAADGWVADEPWTPLRRDLRDPVGECGLSIEVVGAERAGARAAVQRAAFEHSTFSEARWQAMADGPAYAQARCLLAHDDRGDVVACVTVWSAGPGRPGLLEPMGVHRDHRGRGYGTAITTAAAAALRELGSSSATVCTAAAKHGAVATYRSAGFDRMPDVHDLRRVADDAR